MSELDLSSLRTLGYVLTLFSLHPDSHKHRAIVLIWVARAKGAVAKQNNTNCYEKVFIKFSFRFCVSSSSWSKSRSLVDFLHKIGEAQAASTMEG